MSVATFFVIMFIVYILKDMVITSFNVNEHPYLIGISIVTTYILFIIFGMYWESKEK